ncbi:MULTISPECIES: SGNH/GDSL hydrolase family protein [unclassified Aeromicrobium]|uniref:SGNH/GDSL hydrolase family protein n=1 Tax=unclassified Aeromicrobium TaxID=2633570 RepID=UPI002096FDDF|nr:MULTISPECIES: SGNH/GDSL hydrolase family protein [unclassified Aeromicrobium]MCO7237809.1 SGNH/GDSL hydrolase family protein [Aeromicrobium sp. CnD17-E]MDR6116947.1 lysophospholipase L1-like esterase [Aeromicrobium sp. SORGH_AS_0981]
MRAPNKIASQVAVGGLAAVTGYWGVVFGEIIVAKRAIGVTDARPPRADGVYGEDLPRDPVRCLVLGDSAAVGYGMSRADATPPAMLGIGLAHVLDAQVEIRSEAVVGAVTSDLRDQIEAAGDFDPDLVVIIIGTNDVTHRVPAYQSTRLLGSAVRRLVDGGAQVVVGTCPDLGTVRPIPQPLRWIARRKSRALARKQTIAVVRAGGRAVSLGSLLGVLFTEKYDVMFGEDRFHPSETGYANMVSVLVPSLAAAWRERDRDFAVAHFGGSPGTMSLTDAAERAGERDGTEVTRDGRWARILRRR